MMYGLLEKLCSIGGVSGREDKVREFIISEIDASPIGASIRSAILSCTKRERAPRKIKLCSTPIWTRSA